ncbi:MAG: extracellular solute-binding protein [Lachnospiraceae bacterium]|nr:extracellular solute-binding protein [Lachnospiraceae bacterium]
MNVRRNKRRFRACAAGILACFLLLVPTGCKEEEEEPVTTETTYETFEEHVASVKTVTTAEDGTEVPIQITLWYNDAAMTPYYEAAAVDFHDRYGIEVLCTYVDNVNYLEQINQANIEKRGPDVFIASNDEVRKARMAGLTQCNTLYTEEFWAGHYPAVAKSAMTSDGKQYGYPIYLDTAVMIYDAAITAQPESFGSITEFAVNFVDETNTKDIFRWDIADPFYDYLFLGTGAQIFGDTGEDTGLFNVNNENVIQSMTYYQSLHDYFSIDVDSSSYEQIKSKLTDGTLVYGIVKTDVLSELGSYGSSYALCPVPPLSGELPVKNLSVTYGAFVSDFTRQSEYANLFAAYLSYEYAGNLFGLSRRTAVRSDLNRADANEAIIYEQYCNTNPVPKALENGDFWIYTEICFKNIWNGSDVATELSQLQEKMLERLK